MFNNARIIALGLALILVSGLVAIQLLPRQEDPRFGNRHAFVQLFFPGASAERVESLALEPVENALRVLPEVKTLMSSAKAGIGVVVVELDDAIAPEDTDRVWAEVRDKLEEVSKRLPADVAAPVLDKDRLYAYTWIGALVWKGQGEPDLLRLGRYAKELQNRLQGLANTDLVRLHGAPEEQVQVKVDTVRAASVGLDVPRIAGLLSQSDTKTSAGELLSEHYRQSVELVGGYDQLERIRRTPLLSLAEVGSLQLQDIAEVYIGETEKPRDFAIIDGRRAVVIGARSVIDTRADVWTANLEAMVAEFAAELPDEVAVQQLFAQQSYTSVRLSDLVNNILLGFSFIFVILFFTLGWRSAVMVSLSLPVTMLFALAIMNFTGLAIHQMSVTGLIVALGIMVDNAIVVVDQVGRYRRRGFSALAAANKALRHLWMPLLGSTLTTMLTFLPIAMMPGSPGEFVGPLAYTVIYSLLGSWLISLFIIAPICSRWLDERSSEKVLSNTRLAAAYQTLLEFALDKPRRIIALCCLLPVIGFGLAQTLPEQFFPPSQRDMIDIEVFLPASSSVFQTRAVTERLSETLSHYPQVQSLHWFVGASAPKFYYNLKSGQDGSAHYAQALIKLQSYRGVDGFINQLQQELDQQFPTVQINVRKLEQGPPRDAPVELRISGDNLYRLKELGDQLRSIALNTEGVTHVRDSISEVVPKIWLDVDEAEAQRAQVGLRDLSQILSSSIDGVISSSLLDGPEQLPVRVSGLANGPASVDILMSAPLALATGSRPLSALAEVELRPAQAVITRRDGRRVNNIYIFTQAGLLPAVVQGRVQQAMAEQGFRLPAGYKLEIGGDSEARDEAVGKLLGSMGIISVLLVITVVMSFNSFRLSAITFAVAIQSLGLGMLSLWLSGYPFGFTSIIGLMGLMGLAVNAAIVILTELKSSPLAMTGNKVEITGIVMECTRHISSTTLTTVAGLVPLILFGGEFWPPFAIVLAGGTVFTTTLSLIFVPAAFLVLRRPYLAKLLPEQAQQALHGDCAGAERVKAAD